jgi:signal transduction histidine kinase
VTAGLVAAFFAADLALFAGLIYRSLKQRELNRVIDETRQAARDLAALVEESADRTGGDLFTAVLLRRETQRYVDSLPHLQRIVEAIEITDRQGVLVMRERRPDSRETGGTELERAGPETERKDSRQAPSGPLAEAGSAPEDQRAASGASGALAVVEPIGGYGTLTIRLSQVELDARVGELRGELARQTALIGALTAVLVAPALAFISILIRRGERLEAQAAEAARLAYVGTLAAGLAHEIRNPLNSLSLNLQMLEEDLPAGAPGDTPRRLLAVTRAEIARLERLVSEFLRYARPRPLALAETPALDLVLAVRELLAGEIARHDASVRLVDESYQASVRVDAEQIRQLLLNLVQNALASTEDTGRRPELTLFVRRDGAQVEIEVRDNGCGIAPADRERIFDAFYSTRKGGTGLGLAIAQRIARAHGGTLTLDSELDFGSKFVLALPMAPAEGGAAGAGEAR